jgi:hypothetical protein
MSTTDKQNTLYLRIKSWKSGKDCFIEADNSEQLQAVREQTGNVDLYCSSCYYTHPDASAQRVYGLYFAVKASRLEPVRISTIEAIYYLSENFVIPEDCIEVIYNGGGQVETIGTDNKGYNSDVDGSIDNDGYLDGASGIAGNDEYINGTTNTDDNTKDIGPAAEIIIFIKPFIFGRQPSPIVPTLNYRLARRLCEDGIRNINIDVYEKNHFLPLLNCKSTVTGRYFVHLSLKELIFLDATGLRNLAKTPRAEDSLITACHSGEAAEWFAEEIKEIEQKQQQKEKLRALILLYGWQIPACIWRLQRLCLYNNKRLETYRAVSQFYALIGAGKQEICRQIAEMDQRNPIHDYQKLNAIVSFAFENSQFVGCEHPLLKQFCPAGKCFMAELIDEYEKPYLFGDLAGDRKEKI